MWVRKDITEIDFLRSSVPHQKSLFPGLDAKRKTALFNAKINKGFAAKKGRIHEIPVAVPYSPKGHWEGIFCNITTILLKRPSLSCIEIHLICWIHAKGSQIYSNWSKTFCGPLRSAHWQTPSWACVRGICHVFSIIYCPVYLLLKLVCASMPLLIAIRHIPTLQWAVRNSIEGVEQWADLFFYTAITT